MLQPATSWPRLHIPRLAHLLELWYLCLLIDHLYGKSSLAPCAYQHPPLSGRRPQTKELFLRNVAQLLHDRFSHTGATYSNNRLHASLFTWPNDTVQSDCSQMPTSAQYQRLSKLTHCHFQHVPTLHYCSVLLHQNLQMCQQRKYQTKAIFNQ